MTAGSTPLARRAGHQVFTSGAGCAVGSLALARRAGDRELLEGGAGVGETELTEDAS